MLKMREPIKLKTGLQLTGAAESFFERLNGNYNLMNARIAPKDLLFLMTQPMQIPEELFGDTQLNISNSVTDARRVTMEVVNNVVNRIMLSTHPSFTYQDQVYITAMLNKLGVTNVEQFMQEVRRIREEQTNQLELTKLYRQEINRTIKSAGKVIQQPDITVRSAGKTAESAVSPAVRYYLHQEIYDRLETGDIYQELNNIYSNNVSQNTKIANNELKLAEYLRISRDLQLTEAKQNYLNINTPTMHHHINHYEQGDILPMPGGENEVISQAAQAALFSTIERVITQSFERKTMWREPWLEITNSLHQTAENSVSRFESYHSDPDIINHYNRTIEEWQRSVINEEITTLNQLRKTDVTMQQLQHINIEQPVEEQTEIPRAEITPPSQLIKEFKTELQTTHNEFKTIEQQHFEQLPPAEQETVIRENTERITRELKELDRENRERIEKLQTTQTEIHHPADIISETLRRETERHTLENREIINDLQTMEREFKTVEQQHFEQLPPTDQETLIRENTERITRELKELDRENRERIEKLQTTQTEIKHPADIISETLRRETERHTLENREIINDLQTMEREFKTVEQQHFEQLPPADKETVIRENTELIARELREIDRQNRERLERMQIIRERAQQQTKPTPPDPRRTMKDALRALESPEIVMQEISRRQEQVNNRPQPNPIEQVLAYTDNTTRQLLETVLKYESDPQAAIESGLVKVNNTGMLNADSAARQTPPAATEHPAQPQIPPEQLEYIAQQTSRALEHFTEQPARNTVQQRELGKWDETPRIFRRENTNSIEELVERLEERRSQNIQQQNIHEDVIQQNFTQTEIHEQTNKMIAHTTEDITEIVNRQMARQMNTITDQVYRQMERKLQTERNRRGRF